MIIINYIAKIIFNFERSGFALNVVNFEMKNLCGMQLIWKKWKTS